MSAPSPGPIGRDSAASLSELERARAEARELTAIARAVGSARDVREILPEICQRAARLCDADRGTIFLWGENPGGVYPATSRLASDESPEDSWERYRAVGHQPLPSQRLLHHLATTGESVHIENAVDSPLVNQESVEAFNLRSIFGVPLVAGEQAIGALLFNRKEVRPYSAAHRELAEAVADHVAVVLQKALMLEKTERQLSQAEALLEIANSLSSTLELHPLLKTITRQAARACALDRCTVYMWRHGRVLPVMSQFANGHHDTRLWKAFKRTGELCLDDLPFLAEAAGTKAPVLIQNAHDDPRIPDELTIFRFRSLFTVPLVRQDRAVGAIVLDNTYLEDEESDGFESSGGLETAGRRNVTSGQVALATTIASQLVLVLENVRQYEKAQQTLAELRDTQAMLVQSEKFRALAEMAGGVAHDFNNLLTAILGRTQYLIHQLDAAAFSPVEAKRHLTVIEQSARDGAETVRRLLEFTREKPRLDEAVAIDVNELLRQTLEIARPRWKDETEAKGLEIDVRLELGEVPETAGNPAELREVLLNLVLNAIEAMPEGGVLELASRAEDDAVVLVISDSGVGMTPEDLQRIFDPFFTTKGPRSSGLGLSASYGILRRHGCDIEIESEPGEGTTFTLSLPLWSLPDLATEEPLSLPSGSELRVLVIDDEGAVRELLGEMLAVGGHQIEKAASGSEGLEILARQDFDLVLTDLGMPGMTGWEVAQEVRKRWPAVKIGLISGWGPQIENEELAAHGIDFLIPKPFEMQEILKILASL